MATHTHKKLVKAEKSKNYFYYMCFSQDNYTLKKLTGSGHPLIQKKQIVQILPNCHHIRLVICVIILNSTKTSNYQYSKLVTF